MLYIYSLITSVILVFFQSLIFYLKKNEKKQSFISIVNFFFILNFEQFFYFSYFFFILFFCFLVFITIIINYSTPFLETILSIFIEILKKCITANTTYCAGVPKLIDLTIPDFNNAMYVGIFGTKLYDYSNAYNTKDLYKYNFSVLTRHPINFERSSTNEMLRISMDLNFIYNKNIEISKNIFSTENLMSLKRPEQIHQMSIFLNNFINENLFKLKNMELCNNSIGIPLYNDIKKCLINANLPDLNPEAVKCVREYCSYTELGENSEGIFSILKQDKILKRKNYSPNIEAYVYYLHAMQETKNSLELSNRSLAEVDRFILNPNFRDNLLWFNTEFPVMENKDLYNRNGDYLHFDAEELKFSEINSQFVDNKIIDLQNLFFRSIERYPTMLRDINTGQSNMKVDYGVLLRIINNNPDIVTLVIKNKIINSMHGRY